MPIDLGQLLRVRAHLVEDSGAHLLQPHNVGGDAGVRDILIQPFHLPDGHLPVADHLVQLRISCRGRFLFNGLLGLFRRRLASLLSYGAAPAQGGRRRERQKGGPRRQGIVQRLIQRQHQRVGQPYRRSGVKRRRTLLSCGLHPLQPPQVAFNNIIPRRREPVNGRDRKSPEAKRRPSRKRGACFHLGSP